MLIVSTSFEQEIIDKKCNRIFFIDITIKREKRKEKRGRRKKRKKEQAYLTFDGSAKGVQALCEHIVKQTAQREYLTRGQGQVCKGEKIQTNKSELTNINTKTYENSNPKHIPSRGGLCECSAPASLRSTFSTAGTRGRGPGSTPIDAITYSQVRSVIIKKKREGRDKMQREREREEKAI